MVGGMGYGLFLYLNKAPAPPAIPASPAPQENLSIPVTQEAPLPPPPEPQAPQWEPDTPPFILSQNIAAIEALAHLLKNKQEEIEALRAHYQMGNQDLAQTIRRKARRQNITTLAAAMADPQLSVDLQTIQRRQAYITQLEEPRTWVARGIAELAYIHQRFAVDLDLLPVLKDYDITAHRALCKDVLARNQPSAEKLAMNMDTAQLRPLAAIWDETIFVGEGEGFSREDPNFTIWQELCDGEYGRATQLTRLSPAAAQCLAHWEMPDLFLNNLGEMPAESAANLSNWPGRWLCLNGVRQLDLAAGRSLLQWNGERISLNGLETLSPDLALFLPRWPGRHLELMGLDPSALADPSTIFNFLNQWETRGGNVYLPPVIDAQYHKFQAGLQPKPKKYGHGFYFEPEGKKNKE